SRGAENASRRAARGRATGRSLDGHGGETDLLPAPSPRAPLCRSPQHDSLVPDLHRGFRAHARRTAREHADPGLLPLRSRLLSLRDGLCVRDRVPPARARGIDPARAAGDPGRRARDGSEDGGRIRTARPRSGGSVSRRGRGRRQLGLYTILSALALLSLAPLLYMARVSLSKGGDLPIAPQDWFGRPLAIEHYHDLFTGGPMGRFLLNSIIVTGIAVPIQILFSAAAGHALARVRFVGRGVFLALATAFLILPRQVTLVPLYLLM